MSEQEKDTRRWCSVCTKEGRRSQVEYHGSCTSKKCPSYKKTNDGDGKNNHTSTRKKGTTKPSKSPPSRPTSTHDPPFWQEHLEEEYVRWWRPPNPLHGQLIVQDSPTDSWFHHVRYGYASGSQQHRLTRVSPVPTPGSKPAENIGKPSGRKNRKKKRSIDNEEDEPSDAMPATKKGVMFKSQKEVPPGHVLRTYTMRFYPTKEDSKSEPYSKHGLPPPGIPTTGHWAF
ncbi:hypothetical protein BC832DRAFT_593281 [Gaertneriomyces semiglobifer]|nr:hypothetical protein BC832DRAFT_593281 [Gaertneriomyces semiglobifer]